MTFLSFSQFSTTFTGEMDKVVSFCCGVLRLQYTKNLKLVHSDCVMQEIRQRHFMAALCSRCRHYILQLWFLSIYLFFLAHSQWSDIGCLPCFHTWCALSGNWNVLHAAHWKYRMQNYTKTRTRANAQRDGRPAEHRWRPLFNAAKLGSRPLLAAMQ